MRKILGIFTMSLILAGCDSPGTAAAALNADTPSSALQDHQGLKVVALPDPSLGGMAATFVAVPAGWRVDGQMRASPCINLPDPVWSAASPDGRSALDVLPRFAWRWGNNARYARDCDPFSGAPRAAEFLKLLAAKLPGGVEIVGAMPVADAFRNRQENFTDRLNGNNARLTPALRTHSSGDVAALRAADSSGHELRLRVWVQCREGTQGGDCFAKVDVLLAPKGRLDDLAAQIDGHNLIQDVPAEAWQTAYMNRQQQIGAAQMDSLRRSAQAGNAALRKQFVDSSARLRAEHEAGMRQIEQTGQHAMQNSWNAMNARSTAASDWRDYAGDQQTVSGVNGTYKTSSQYTNVWSSPYGPALSDGRTFGSTDDTVDPNTATDNTFSQDHKVHGNGQSY